MVDGGGALLRPEIDDSGGGDGTANEDDVAGAKGHTERIGRREARTVARMGGGAVTEG